MKLTKLVNELAQFEPDGSPVLSIYLNNASANEGPTAFEPWLRKELTQIGRKFEAESVEAVRFDALAETIWEFLADLDPGARGAAIFAGMSEDGIFETLQIDEPFPNNRLLSLDRPHLYPLVRMVHQNPKYVALWADTNKADIYIFGGENHLDVAAETRAKIEEIQGDKTRRTHVGGWSQARYQRHVENFHLQHAKETVAEVEKLLREAKIDHLILCGDETAIMPVLRPQLSQEAEARVVGTLNLSQYASEREIHETTREMMRERTTLLGQEAAEKAFNAARSSAGLGSLGVEDTLTALANGQVEELVLSTDLGMVDYDAEAVSEVLEAYAPGEEDPATVETAEKRNIADELIIRALHSGAKITFVEGDELAEAGGVGAVLRYNIHATAG